MIAGIAILAVVGMHPAARMAERFLEREGITEVGVANRADAHSPSLG